MRVVIIGAGLMEAQIGCEYALGGHDVRVHSRDLVGAQQRVAGGFALLDAHGLSTKDEVRAAAARISTAAEPGDAARDAHGEHEFTLAGFAEIARRGRRARSSSTPTGWGESPRR